MYYGVYFYPYTKPITDSVFAVIGGQEVFAPILYPLYHIQCFHVLLLGSDIPDWEILRYLQVIVARLNGQSGFETIRAFRDDVVRLAARLTPIYVVPVADGGF